MLLVGTRSSRLALKQTEEFITKTITKNPNLQFQTIPIKTTGDLITNKPLVDIGGKALFLKELEEALLDNRIDLAVHSLKDVPAFLPQGLTLSAFLARGACEEAVIARKKLSQLDKGSVIGTSSSRRKAFLLHLFGNRFKIVDIRGNLDSRLKKFKEGLFDALILAKVGLERLGLEDYISEILPPDLLLPAIGQGVITVETRSADHKIQDILHQVTDRKTLVEVTAERSFMMAMEGNCKTPIAALARRSSDFLQLDAAFALPNGEKIFHFQGRQAIFSPEKELSIATEIGLEAAEKIKTSLMQSNFYYKVLELGLL